MPTLEPELAKLLRGAIDDRLLDVHTCTLGKVHAVYPSPTDPTGGKKYADVALPIRRPVLVEDDSTTYERLPIIPMVPIAWPASNGTDYPLDVTAGDTVLVLFSENSTAEFWDSGSESQPADLSMHALTSALCWPISRATTTAADFAALASLVQTALNNVVTWLTAHTHPVVGATAGPSVLTPPVVTPVTATVTRAK